MIYYLSPLILTLELDPSSFEIFNTLRKEHFPPERNFLAAHLTLFHKLPGEQEVLIKQTLREISSRPALPLAFSNLRFLGKGVAVNVESSELIELRKKLATTWQHWLEAQDKQSFKPHVTVQNKVTPDEATALLEHLQKTWTPLTGKGTGLLLWRYLGGPWELVEQFSFSQ
jgi:2'-5' RNA ligase